MNFQPLPPEIIARCLGYANYETITKIRRTCKAMNNIVKRHDLHIPVVHKATLMNNNESLLNKENAVEIHLEQARDTSKDPSSAPIKVLPSFKYDTSPNMKEVYKMLFSEIRGAETLSVYDVQFDSLFLEAIRKHRFESQNTVLVTEDCSLNLSINETIQLFRAFKKVDLRNCKMPSRLLCDEVFAVMIEKEVKLMLYYYDQLKVAPLVTNKTLVALQHSPWLTHSSLDIEKVKTKFTFAAIQRIIMEVANLSTHHSMELNLGYIDEAERRLAAYGTKIMENHPKISVHSDSENRYLWIIVQDTDTQDEVTGNFSKSEFRIYMGDKVVGNLPED